MFEISCYISHFTYETDKYRFSFIDELIRLLSSDTPQNALNSRRITMDKWRPHRTIPRVSAYFHLTSVDIFAYHFHFHFQFHLMLHSLPRPLSLQFSFIFFFLLFISLFSYFTRSKPKTIKPQSITREIRERLLISVRELIRGFPFVKEILHFPFHKLVLFIRRISFTNFLLFCQLRFSFLFCCLLWFLFFLSLCFYFYSFSFSFYFHLFIFLFLFPIPSLALSFFLFNSSLIYFIPFFYLLTFFSIFLIFSFCLFFSLYLLRSFSFFKLFFSFFPFVHFFFPSSFVFVYQFFFF